MSIFTQFLEKIISVLLPHICLLCQQPVKQRIDLCPDCKAELPWINQACQQCGLPLINALKCGKCLKRPPYFDRTFTLFHYQAPVKQLITRLKFQQKLVYANMLGALMADQFQSYYQDKTKPEFIIPVPLHPKRLRERGFNQALELARPIIKKTSIPLNLSCQRIRNTAPQTQIRAAKRKRNIKNAFAIDSVFRARHVAIIDDVMTTGSTLLELSRILKISGVKQIDIWCVARTYMNK